MPHRDKRRKDRSPAELLAEGHPQRLRPLPAIGPNGRTVTFAPSRTEALKRANRPLDRWEKAWGAGERIILACLLAIASLIVAFVAVYAL
jgi:hypothetical protein